MMELSRAKIATFAFGESLRKFFSGHREIASQASDPNIQKRWSFEKIKSRFKAYDKKTLLKLTVFVLALLVIVFLAWRVVGRKTETFSGPLGSPQKTVNLSKTFQFAGRIEDGRMTDVFLKMTITSAETTKQILIQGKPATAKGGKFFLIINLEIDNSHNAKLFISPVDLIRLVALDGKKFAPDVHNNQVSIEPISIKKTRVGFVIDEETSGWKLQIGEVAGAKETIDLPI